MSLKVSFVITGVFLLLSGQLLAGESHYVLMGGGGEEEGPETIFDIEVENAGNFLKSNSHWTPDVTYNGGHSNTEKIIENTFGSRGVKNVPFTEPSFENKIQVYEDKIRNGEIASGGQLLIQVSSHGAIQKDNERTHMISASGHAPNDMTTLEGSKLVSLDALERLASLAEEKGVNLAILDFSCHSGSSLALANSKTCVISSTGPDHFGWANTHSVFQAKFTKGMRKGRSLEDIFIQAVDDKYDTSFPMISSPTGKELQDELYPRLTPFLYDARSESVTKKLVDYLENEARENRCRELPKNFENLISFSQDMENLVKKKVLFFNRNEDFSGFRNSLSQYYDLQKKILNDISKIEFEAYDEEQRFCENYRGQPKDTATPRNYMRCSEWSVREILSMDYEKNIDLLNAQLEDEEDEFQRKGLQASIKNFENAQAKSLELLRERPELAEYINYFDNLPELREDSKELAYKVANEFADLYTKVYKNKMKSETEPNPCRDFKL